MWKASLEIRFFVSSGYPGQSTEIWEGELKIKQPSHPQITLLYSGKNHVQRWLSQTLSPGGPGGPSLPEVPWKGKKAHSRIHIYWKETACSQSMQCAWRLPLDLVYQWDLWDLLSLLDPVNLTQRDLTINTEYYNLIKGILHSLVEAIYTGRLLNCKSKELTVGPRCPLGPGLPCNPWKEKFTEITLAGTLFVR